MASGAISIFAYVYVGLGGMDVAFDWSEKAVEQPDTLVKYLGVEPSWDPLRSHPRFQGLLRRMNLQ